MPKFIAGPTRVEAAGNKPKVIDEYVGRVNSATTETSIAHMRSPGGWLEPRQTPEFDEFTVAASMRRPLPVKGEIRPNPLVTILG